MSGRTSVQVPNLSKYPASQLVSSNLAALAEPPVQLVDGAVMDYLVIEMVNALKASSAVATARSKQIEHEMIEAGLLPPPPPPSLAKKPLPNPRDSVISLSGKSADTASGKLDDEEEAVRVRLEAIGSHVGANLAERLCRDKTLFSETLDVIKFICKDIWTACWDKQVDNLRTNHRGVYVLQDNGFKPILRLSSWKGRIEAARRARLYVAMPAGIIKGALVRLGYNATVTTEVSTVPQCTFQVKMPKGT